MIELGAVGQWGSGVGGRRHLERKGEGNKNNKDGGA